MRTVLALAAVLLLAACSRSSPVVPPSTAVGSALTAGVYAAAPVARLGISTNDAEAALASFIESCPRLLARDDTSGLTTQSDWVPACEAARSWPSGRARSFFIDQFSPVRVGDGSAFATGYFEPEIAGSRTRRPGFDVPVYVVPDDLTRGWPAGVPASEQTGRPPLGRVAENGEFVRYFERSEIEQGALEGKVAVIGWAADPIEFFFLQIQGSGRLRSPEGEVIRIGYAGQNGREYVSIGGVMRERGLFGSGPGQYPGSMQGIMSYLRENPADGRELMRLNKSWIFFRELRGDGPLGALSVPVRPQSSVAVDPKFVPLGAPVWLDLDRDEADGLWIAQDTGGAIKGANRFDTFWGAGAEARTIAGGMSGRGQAVILLPKPVAKRLAQEP